MNYETPIDWDWEVVSAIRESAMKKIAAWIAGVVILAGQAEAAVLWTYDFGTGTGSYETNNSDSTTFLPAPSEGGGTARVRRSSDQGGGFYLENPGHPDLGEDTELRVLAATGGSVNKFSIYGYADPSETFSMGFTMRLSGGASGDFQFFAGSGDSYSNNNIFNGNQAFSGLQWRFGPDNVLTNQHRSGGSWVALSGSPFSQDTIYEVEIYGNNSSASMDYLRNNTTYAVAENTWDLWINGTRTAGLNKALLPANTTIDSLMFIGINSTGNVATLQVDDIWYSNVIPEPGTGILLLAGVMATVGAVRRRRC